MSDEAKVRELFAPFAERPVDLEGREFLVNREAAVAVILKTAQEPVRTHPRRLAVWGGAVAAGLALAASALLFLSRGATDQASATKALVEDVTGVVTHWQGQVSQPVAAGPERRQLVVNGELRTSDRSSARIRNARGDTVALFENSRVMLGGFDSDSRQLELLAGSIRCEVPDLASGKRFSVLTPHATVEVRGTAFSVLVSGMAEAARTCVKVERGAVVVKASGLEKQLGAGESWGCETSAHATPLGTEGAPATAVEGMDDGSSPDPKPSPRLNDRGDGKAPKAGTLDEENRLFQAGLAAERRRDFAAARAAFEQLLTRFPASPLAKDALVARARVQGQAPTP